MCVLIEQIILFYFIFSLIVCNEDEIGALS
jgi:hypothetical protein